MGQPTTQWVREYLSEEFPGQPLPERPNGKDDVVIDVNDSRGYPKELRISLEFLQVTKLTTQEYLRNAKIAEQLEAVLCSVTILGPL